MVKHAPPEIRRGQILLAAMQVCGEKGYHATRIDDIAEAAGLSKGAIYHHFRSKQEIFVELLEQVLDEAMADMAALDARGVSIGETLNSVYAKQMEMAQSNPQLVRGLFEFYLLSFRDPEFRDRFDAHYQKLLDRGAEVLRHAIDRGELEPDTDPVRAARVLLIGGDGLMLMHIMLDQEEQGIDAALYFTNLVVKALSREVKP